MTTHNLTEVKAAAAEKLREEDFKIAVENEKIRMRLMGGKIKKRIIFQWPVKFVDRFVAHNRRRTDKGRTR